VEHHVRPATVLDAQSISTLILAGSASGVGTEGTSEELNRWRTANATSSKVLERINDGARTHVLVVESDDVDGLLGTAYVTLLGDHRAHFGGLYCSVRGEGVGSSLIARSMEWCKSFFVTSIETEIACRNVEMAILAAKFGFQLESEYVDDFFPSGHFGRWRSSRSHP
jgi:RimJ/RimL family protein N-acetyltransferase